MKVTQVATRRSASIQQEETLNSPLVLASGASAGVVTGSLALGVQLGAGAVSGGASAGAVLGVGASGLLLALNRQPLGVITALVALAPLAFIGGQLAGFPAIGLAPVLLAVLATFWLVMKPKARASLAPDLGAGAVIIYALLVAFGLRTIPLDSLLPAACMSLLPIVLFFAGMMLPALATVAPEAYGQNELEELTPHTRVMRYLVLASLCAAFLFAVLVSVLGPMLPNLIPTLSPSATPHPSASIVTMPLAHVLGATLVLLLAWDSRGDTWRALLGRDRAGAKTAASRWELLRRVSIGIVVLGLPVLVGELALTWSRSTLVAICIAMVWSALLRRRFGALLVVALLALPIFAIVPYGTAGWLGTQISAFNGLFDGSIGHTVAAAITSAPFGPGFSISDFAAKSGSYYLVILHALGVPGLIALLASLVILFVRMWRVRRHLRLFSGEAGAVAAGGSLLLFVVAISVTSTPLAEPATAMIFWLFLGVANGIVCTLENGTLSKSAARGYPLRVAYVLHSDEDGETPLALYDLLQSLERRHVTPLLITVGRTSLVAHARNLQISCRVIPLRDPDLLKLSLRWVTSEQKLLRWLAGNRLVYRALAVGDRVMLALDVARQGIGIARALFELHPDLVVSNSAATHIPTLAVAGLSGAPVIWHLHARPPAQLQPLLDTLVPWTSAALVPSQEAASAFKLGTLAHLVRVVRPGVTPSEPVTPARRAELRREHNIPDDATVLVYPALPSSVNAHLELMQILLALAKHYPSLHLVVAHEELTTLTAADDDPEAEVRERGLAERLRQTLRLGSEEGLVTWIGGCVDLIEVISMGDIAILPLQTTPTSRMVLHAMASGVPIMALRTASVEELLAGSWGFKLVASAKTKVLAESLAEMLQNLDRYKSEARRNPGVVRDWYTATLEAGRIITVYQGICLPSKLLERRKAFRRRQTRYPQGWLSTLQQFDANTEEALDA